MNIIPDTITPSTIEAATISLESTPEVTGTPRSIPAKFSPITPPRNEPGRSLSTSPFGTDWRPGSAGPVLSPVALRRAPG